VQHILLAAIKKTSRPTLITFYLQHQLVCG